MLRLLMLHSPDASGVCPSYSVFLETFQLNLLGSAFHSRSVHVGPKERYMMITRLLSHFFSAERKLNTPPPPNNNSPFPFVPKLGYSLRANLCRRHLDAAHLYVPYDSGRHGSLNICSVWGRGGGVNE